MEAKELSARIRALDLPDLQKRLLKRAIRLGATPDQAGDVVQRAFILLMQKGHEKWDPAADPTAYRFLRKRVRWGLDDLRAREEERRTDLDTDAVEESPPSSDAGGLRVAVDREESAILRDELLTCLADNPLAVDVVKVCMREGELKPREIAELLGATIDRIYKCQERIKLEISRIAKRRANAAHDRALP